MNIRTTNSTKRRQVSHGHGTRSKSKHQKRDANIISQDDTEDEAEEVDVEMNMSILDEFIRSNDIDIDVDDEDECENGNDGENTDNVLDSSIKDDIINVFKVGPKSALMKKLKTMMNHFNFYSTNLKIQHMKPEDFNLENIGGFGGYLALKATKYRKEGGEPLSMRSICGYFSCVKT